jgi:hypothetical protein
VEVADLPDQRGEDAPELVTADELFGCAQK